MLQGVVFAYWLTMMGALLVAWAYQVAVLRRLRRHHPEAWREMHSPWPWLPTLRPEASGAVARFLFWRGYRAFPDEKVRRLAARSWGAAIVSIALFLFAFAYTLVRLLSAG